MGARARGGEGGEGVGALPRGLDEVGGDRWTDWMEPVKGAGKKGCCVKAVTPFCAVPIVSRPPSSGRPVLRP